MRATASTPGQKLPDISAATINNVSYRQKGARRYPLDLTDEKTVVGITTMQSESSYYGHRGGSLELIQPPPSRSKQTRAVLGRFE